VDVEDDEPSMSMSISIGISTPISIPLAAVEVAVVLLTMEAMEEELGAVRQAPWTTILLLRRMRRECATLTKARVADKYMCIKYIYVRRTWMFLYRERMCVCVCLYIYRYVSNMYIYCIYLYIVCCCCDGYRLILEWEYRNIYEYI